MAADDFDVIIVGSGAGGSAAAYQLTRCGLKVALVEKGGALPRDGTTLDFKRVVQVGEFKSRELWRDNRGGHFSPEEYFNLGGKTKWYGAALLRYARHEFGADQSYQCREWPISYDELLPFYEQAERLLGVRRYATEPDLQRIAGRLGRRGRAWHHEPMPLGLSPGILGNPAEARHFDGFASVADLKADAETSFLQPVRGDANLTILTGRPVVELLGAQDDATRIAGVRLADGTELHGAAVLLAAGALHSPRLLQHYLDAKKLSHSVPAAAQVGRNLKLHLLTAVLGISATRFSDLLRKTLLFLHRDFPHSSVQPLGFDGELLGTLIPGIVPRPLARWIGERSYGFFLQTEDGAHRDNRVIAAAGAAGDYPVFDYDAARTPASLAEHRLLVRRFRGALARAGIIAFSQRIGISGTAHVSGTLVAGTDASQSVVDSEGCVHGMKSLVVVDGSVLPRSSRVNPSLTIYAWALRAADALARRLRQAAT